MIDLLGALCARSTRRSRSKPENHRELPVGVREAVEILAAIESTGGARAALDGPDGPLPCALNARGARGGSCSHAQRFGGLAALVVDAALLGW